LRVELEERVATKGRGTNPKEGKRHASQEISALKRAVQLVFGTKIEAAFLLKIGMISKVLGDRNSYS
jgi:hypothetical protein